MSTAVEQIRADPNVGEGPEADQDEAIPTLKTRVSRTLSGSRIGGLGPRSR